MIVMASAALIGQSSVTSTGEVTHRASSHITGAANMVAATQDEDPVACTIVATSYVFIDPHKVKLITPFGTPESIPARYRPQTAPLRPAVPGQPQGRSQRLISPPYTQPRQTRVGGIKNKG